MRVSLLSGKTRCSKYALLFKKSWNQTSWIKDRAYWKDWVKAQTRRKNGFPINLPQTFCYNSTLPFEKQHVWVSQSYVSVEKAGKINNCLLLQEATILKECHLLFISIMKHLGSNWIMRSMLMLIKVINVECSLLHMAWPLLFPWCQLHDLYIALICWLHWSSQFLLLGVLAPFAIFGFSLRIDIREIRLESTRPSKSNPARKKFRIKNRQIFGASESVSTFYLINNSIR